MRALGDDYDEYEEGFWYANPVQGVALSDNYYNPGFTRLEENGDRVVDTAKKFMQKTWAGREVVWSSTAEPKPHGPHHRAPSTWANSSPHGCMGGPPATPIAAVPTNDGTGNTFTYFDSQMFAYERGDNWICQGQQEVLLSSGPAKFRLTPNVPRMGGFGPLSVSSDILSFRRHET